MVDASSVESQLALALALLVALAAHVLSFAIVLARKNPSKAGSKNSLHHLERGEIGMLTFQTRRRDCDDDALTS